MLISGMATQDTLNFANMHSSLGIAAFHTTNARTRRTTDLSLYIDQFLQGMTEALKTKTTPPAQLNQKMRTESEHGSKEQRESVCANKTFKTSRRHKIML